MRIIIIGIGGIGTILVDKISRFVNYSNLEIQEMILIDGDEFEPKNSERQEFTEFGPKAEIKAYEISKKFKSLGKRVGSINYYITNDNIGGIIQNGDIVLLCVDNHTSRKLVSDYCSTLQDITIISGGNDYTDGNVMVYVRKNNIDITPKITKYHSEINNPEDKHPEEMSCQELANVEPQIFFTNLMAATFMCCAFYNVIIKENFKYSEVYFDMLSMKSDSKVREV